MTKHLDRATLDKLIGKMNLKRVEGRSALAPQLTTTQASASTRTPQDKRHEEVNHVDGCSRLTAHRDETLSEKAKIFVNMNAVPLRVIFRIFLRFGFGIILRRLSIIISSESILLLDEFDLEILFILN